MDIVCSTDNNFLLYLGVAICSICENNGGQALYFHIIVGNDVTDSRKAMLADMASRYGSRISFYSINESVLAEFPVGQPGQPPHITPAAYYRLFLASLLPDDIDKVLYLDCDILNVSGLSDLWGMDISGYAIAAAPDMYTCERSVYDRLGYPVSLGYFNSGVMLVNLKYWRDNNIQEEFMKFWYEHPERVLFHDQDILNFVLRNRKKTVHLKFNVQEPMLHKVLPLPDSFKSEIEEALSSPVIIHFTTPSKPWVSGCKHPYKKAYFKIHELSGLPKFKIVRRKISLYWRLRNSMNSLGILRKADGYRRVVL